MGQVGEAGEGGEGFDVVVLEFDEDLVSVGRVPVVRVAHAD